jgi:hypothetical protein
MPNPVVEVQFKTDRVTLPFWKIELLPPEGSSIEDSRTTGLVVFKDIRKGSDALLAHFKNAMVTSQSLEHWPVQGGATYWDNLLYILEQVAPMYGLRYTVQNAPKQGNPVPVKMELGGIELDILPFIIK